MKKSLLIALGVATLATTVLTMTFNATNVSDNLSADPVEPNHTYVFNKETTPLTDNGDNTYTATKTLDTGSSLALNISYTSETTWTYDSGSASLFKADATNEKVEGEFIFELSLFSGISNPRFWMLCGYCAKDGAGGGLYGEPVFTPSTPSTSYYSSVIAQADVEPYSWTVRFTLKSFLQLEPRI